MNHRAKVALTPEKLMEALGAPVSVALRKVFVGQDPDVVWLVFEHPDLPSVDPLAEAPVLSLAEAVEFFEDSAVKDAYR